MSNLNGVDDFDVCFIRFIKTSDIPARPTAEMTSSKIKPYGIPTFESDEVERLEEGTNITNQEMTNEISEIHDLINSPSLDISNAVKKIKRTKVILI